MTFHRIVTTQVLPLVDLHQNLIFSLLADYLNLVRCQESSSQKVRLCPSSHTTLSLMASSLYDRQIQFNLFLAKVDAQSVQVVCFWS